MSGYRNTGDRAIRIDMLERLADMLRLQDSRSGFECNSDMLSITGMTLEQFAELMVGLGYKAEKGSRLKAVLEDHTDPKTQINQITLEEAVDDPDVNLKEVIINESNDDTASVKLGESVQINVGLNDGDDDNDLLTTSILTLPTQGIAVVSDNSNFYDFITYTPNEDATGTDVFTYEVSDGKGGTNTARVDITITPASGDLDITGPEVYRFFSTQSGTHFYSRDEFEANFILANLILSFEFKNISFVLPVILNPVDIKIPPAVAS